MGYAFISYSSHNQSTADAIRGLFSKHNIGTWMAPYDILPGAEYADVLNDALEGCSCLVLMLTDSAQNSPWVKKEVNLAISYKKAIIPVKLEDIELNSTMKLYLNDRQIIPVKVIDERFDEIQKLLGCVISLVDENAEGKSCIVPGNKNVSIGGHSYIKGQDICCSRYFVGRENELALIKDSFNSKKKGVFLHGIGGIGKTELAIKYAEINKSSYDVVLFLKYNKTTTLQDMLDTVEIENFIGDVKEKREKFRSLIDERTLVIVDNFDVESASDDGLRWLFETKAHVLISTRTDFSAIYNGDKYTQIEIKELASDVLEQVFLSNAQINKISDNDRTILLQIFKLIEYHTYATELLAKQMYYSGWSLELLHQKIKSGLASLENVEKVVSNKDEYTEKNSLLNILRAVFKVSDLTEEQKQVLRNMALLCSFIGVNKNIYKEYCNSELHIHEYDLNSVLGYSAHRFYFTPIIPESSKDIDTINTLFELGWIQIKNAFYVLHPLVSDIVSIDLTPSAENCVKFYEYVKAKLSYFEWFRCEDEADKKTHVNDLQLLSQLINNLNFNDKTNRELATKFLKCIVEDPEEDFICMLDAPACKSIINKLEKYNDNSSLDLCERYEINAILLLIQLYLYDLHLNYKSISDKEKELRSKRILYAFDSTKAIAPKVNKTNDLIDDLSWFVRSVRRIHILSPDLLSRIIAEYPKLIEHISCEIKTYCGIHLSEEEANQLEKNAAEMKSLVRTKSDEELQEEKDNEEWENKINQMYKVFLNSKNKLEYAKWLYEKSGLEIFEVVACLFEFCDELFFYGAQFKPEEVMNINWQEIENVLDYAEGLQKSDAWKESYYGYSLYDRGFWYNKETGKPTNDCVSNVVWRAQLAALMEKWQLLDEYITENKEFFYSCDDRVFKIEGACIWCLARTCFHLKKCHKIIKYLVDLINEWEDDRDFDERDNITIFEEIIEYAELSCVEVGADHPEYNEYMQIYKSFSERVNRLTKKNYKLKSEIKSE
ncbi:MAG: TIR domain-containing protein [Clostridia bacterium]|nr:TIR domain-containing protein [Clostridia bacterium]